MNDITIDQSCLHYATGSNPDYVCDQRQYVVNATSAQYMLTSSIMYGGICLIVIFIICTFLHGLRRKIFN